MEKLQKQNLCGGCGGCLDCLRIERGGVPEDIISMTVHEAAGQALWDLKQWVKDHEKNCQCFTCCDTIPDLERALNPTEKFHGVCC